MPLVTYHLSLVTIKMTTNEAFNYCEKLTRSHYENFPVGSLLVPKEKRKYVWAVYAFARTADDFADEGRHASETQVDLKKRLDQLDDWEFKLDQSVRGHAEHPAFIAVAETLRQVQIPVQLLKDLLTAYRMDVQKNRYKNFDEVLYYCKHSANPVGRLVLHIFGYKDETIHQLSDHICTALQLANFWQDVAIDLEKNRIYLPQDLMDQLHVTEEQLHRHICNAEFKTLLQTCMDRTAELFNAGLPLCSRVHSDLKLEMRLTWLGGTTILKKIVLNDYDVFRRRPVITLWDKLSLLLQSLLSKKIGPYDL